MPSRHPVVSQFCTASQEVQAGYMLLVQVCGPDGEAVHLPPPGEPVINDTFQHLPFVLMYCYYYCNYEQYENTVFYSFLREAILYQTNSNIE